MSSPAKRTPERKLQVVLSVLHVSLPNPHVTLQYWRLRRPRWCRRRLAGAAPQLPGARLMGRGNPQRPACSNRPPVRVLGPPRGVRPGHAAMLVVWGRVGGFRC